MSSVLVTGSSGRIGRAVVTELMQRGHRVRGFDRVPVSEGGPKEFVQGDLLDRAALERAMVGMDCLVHLAATPDDADFIAEILPNNLLGVYHVLESARLAGVRRLVLASSGQVNWWQQREGRIPVTTSDLPSPRYWYAAAKMFLESIGQGFAMTHGLDVVAVRLGWCPRTVEQQREIAAESWAQDVYLSPGDAGRFFACAVETPGPLGYAMVFAASRPRAQDRFDPGPARRLLGYAPQDTWPEGL